MIDVFLSPAYASESELHTPRHGRVSYGGRDGYIAVSPAEIRAWFQANAAEMVNDKYWKEQPKPAAATLRPEIRAAVKMAIAEFKSPCQVPDRKQPLPARRFGLEIEGFLLGSAVRSLMTGYLHDIIGRTATSPGWGIKFDETITPPFASIAAQSFEIVTPILKGEEGLAEYDAVAKGLYAGGLRANKSCGLHLTVDMKDASLPEFKRLAHGYRKNIAACYSYLAPWRHDNEFCRPNIFREPERIDGARTLAELVAELCSAHIYPAFEEDSANRRRLLDLNALFVHNAIQWRGKEGQAFADASGYIREMVGFTDKALSDPAARLPDISELKPSFRRRCRHCASDPSHRG